MFSGLTNHLSNATFMQNLGVIYHENVTPPPKAKANLSWQICLLKSMSEQPGTTAEELQITVDLKPLKEMPLINASR